MVEPSGAFRYISYARARWRFPAACCGAALLLTLATTLLLPREYTATARILIEPPAGMDPRSAMAVSPIYLESLKTYEQFASSDSLFLKALDRFRLRESLGAHAVESLKKRVLKVGLVRNTRILEIQATLPDAVKAQALASFMASSTVALNRDSVSAADESLVQGIERQVNDLRSRLQQSQAAWAELSASEPIGELQVSLTKAGEMRSALQQQALGAQLELADDQDREKQVEPAERDRIRKEESNARARLAEIQTQSAALDRETAAKEKLLGERQARRDRLEGQRKMDEAALAAAETRLRETRSDAGYRGERLEVIDPGIVPERPSSPNLPLNMAAALLLSLVFCGFYLALEMSWREQRAYRDLARARHE